MSISIMFLVKLCCFPLRKVLDVMSIVSRRGTLCSLLFSVCFVLVFTCVENVSATPSLGSSNSGCSNVKAIFKGRGMSLATDFLQEPSSGGVCGATSSCCGPTLSNNLSMTARRDLETTVRTQAMKVATLLQSRAKKFDENFKNLLYSSKVDFNQMFTRTYGMIYERHAHLFADVFKNLERYHERGDLDLARAMDEFFAVLYQKMFAVLNSQYHFDDKYMQCVSQHMRELQPFGDVPKKMALQVKRAFVATRTFTKALISAGEVARNMATMRSQNTCGSMMVRAQSCAACSGLTEKACPNLCLNAARACLPLHADLSTDWDAFVDAMDKVADRLIGPFNIAMVVEPIDIKISEAIMNFQERSQELSETVFTGCGKPVLGQKPVDTKYYQNQRMKRNVQIAGYANYHDVASNAKSTKSDNSDDFEIETSEESILKKNPFLLSRGSSRYPSLNDKDKRVDMKTRVDVNLNTDSKNDLNDETSPYQDIRSKDKRMIYERLAQISRSRRDADPEAAVKDSKEINFETYDFDANNQRGGGNRKKGRRKQQQPQQQGGRKKKVQEEIMSVVSEEDEDMGDSHLNRSIERLVREVRTRVRETRRLWSRIPQIHCDSLIAGQEEKCWNGTHIAKYLPPLAGEGSSALATNSELRGSGHSSGNVANVNSGGTPAAAIITAQQFTLKSIISKLKNAYNGLDVEWREEEESSSLMYGSGSGSGDIPETDEEDDKEPGGPPDQEGSGHHREIPESPKFDPKEPDQDIDDSMHYNPPVVIQNETEPTEDLDNGSDINENTIDNEIDKDRGSSSTSGVVGREEMSLERALITYLFPIVCVWFGGIITDIA